MCAQVRVPGDLLLNASGVASGRTNFSTLGCTFSRGGLGGWLWITCGVGVGGNWGRGMDCNVVSLRRDGAKTRLFILTKDDVFVFPAELRAGIMDCHTRYIDTWAKTEALFDMNL